MAKIEVRRLILDPIIGFGHLYYELIGDNGQRIAQINALGTNPITGTPNPLGSSGDIVKIYDNQILSGTSNLSANSGTVIFSGTQADVMKAFSYIQAFEDFSNANAQYLPYAATPVTSDYYNSNSGANTLGKIISLALPINQTALNTAKNIGSNPGVTNDILRGAAWAPIFDASGHVIGSHVEDIAGANKMNNGHGNDVLVGLGGNDVFRPVPETQAYVGYAGSDGKNTIYGGAENNKVFKDASDGTDTYIYRINSLAREAVAFSDRWEINTPSDPNDQDILYSIENVFGEVWKPQNKSDFHNLNGSLQLKDLMPTQLANIQSPLGLILTTASEVTIGGNVSTIGNMGTFIGTTSADTFTLNQVIGRTFDGNNGIDSVSYAGVTDARGLKIDLNAGTILISGSDRFAGPGVPSYDTIKSIENATGSEYRDTLTGSNTINILSGGGGDDNFISSTILSGLDGDTFNGGAGIDTADYSTLKFGLKIDLNNGTAQRWDSATNVFSGGVDKLISVESAIGTAYNDQIFGTAGNDIMKGGFGNDTYKPGRGQDTIEDKFGSSDTLILDNFTEGVQLFLNYYMPYYSASQPRASTVTGIENYVLGTGNDTITAIEPLYRSQPYTVNAGGGIDKLIARDSIVVTGNSILTVNSTITQVEQIGFSGITYILNIGRISPEINAYVRTLGHDYDSSAYSVKWLDYSAYGKALTIDTVANIITDGTATDRYVYEPTGMIGTNYNDTVTLSTGSMTYWAGKGNDTITIQAGAGSAGYYGEIIYSNGIDKIYGANDMQKITLGAGITAADVTSILEVNKRNYQYSTFITSYNFDLQVTVAGHGTVTIYDRTRAQNNGNDGIFGTADDTTNSENNPNIYLTDGRRYDTSYINPVLVGTAVTSSTPTPYNDVLTAPTTSSAGSYMNGMSGDDIINSAANGSFLVGGPGNDTLNGGAGYDYLYGDIDNDTLYGQGNSDALYGDLGNDKLYGGTGDDNLYGGDGNDILNGETENDRLYGEAGNDTLNGGDGNDWLEGGSGGANILNGGMGDDTYVLSPDGAGKITETGGSDRLWISLYDAWNIHFAKNGTDLVVTAADATGSLTIANQFGTDIQAKVESIIFSDGFKFDLSRYSDMVYAAANGGVTNGDANGVAKADFILASSSIDFIDTGALADIVDAGGGDDTVHGGAAHDEIYGADGNDLLYGEDDSDWIYGGMGDDTISGGNANDYLSGEYGNDILYGDAGADTMNGGNGDDTLNGGNDNDYIYGDDGNDVLIGGAGDDSLDGGYGIDTASYASSTAAVTVNLSLITPQNTVGAGTDKILNIENIIGSAFADTLTGDAFANMIRGGAGNDILSGGGGIDTLSYSDDTAGVTVSLALTTAQNTGAATGTDTISGFENLTGTAFNDILAGDANANILDGLGGVDTLTYAAATAGVTVNLSLTTAQNTGGAGTDTLSGFENLTGSGFNDVLSGTDGVNVINGGAGNDSLYGDGGADTLTGGTGLDTFVFKATTAFSGVDTIADFKKAEGDRLDLSNLLSGAYDPLTKAITDFVEITTSGANSIVRVDVDGTGSAATWQQIATLTGVVGLTDEAALVSSGNLII